MVYEKLLLIQGELKAPKNQYNSFGKYSYRSCEDILEAVKPICKEVNATLFLSDEIVLIGSRFYVKATAVLVDNGDMTQVSVSAFAREQDELKGMTEAQITGSASSYARKYALNGLFEIDDNKDDDTRDNRPIKPANASNLNGKQSGDKLSTTNGKVAVNGKETLIPAMDVISTLRFEFEYSEEQANRVVSWYCKQHKIEAFTHEELEDLKKVIREKRG